MRCYGINNYDRCICNSRWRKWVTHGQKVAVEKQAIGGGHQASSSMLNCSPWIIHEKRAKEVEGNKGRLGARPPVAAISTGHEEMIEERSVGV